jgi:hypothetical protein
MDKRVENSPLKMYDINTNYTQKFDFLLTELSLSAIKGKLWVNVAITIRITTVYAKIYNF